jgi:dihydropyrimidinase
VEERASALWTLGVRTGRLSPEAFVALLSTNQARVHGMHPRKGTLTPGADADIVVWDPELQLTMTAGNRHGNVDHSPWEGFEATGAPASVYRRGELAYQDGEVVAGPGSGRFIQRRFHQPGAGPAVR